MRSPYILTLLLFGICSCTPLPPPLGPNPRPSVLTAEEAARITAEVVRQQRELAIQAGCDSIHLSPWRDIAPPDTFSSRVRAVIRDEVARRSTETAALCSNVPYSLPRTRALRSEIDSLHRESESLEVYLDQFSEPLPDVYFDFNRVRMRLEDTITLRKVAEALQLSPQVRVIISGYADEAGPAELNMQIARARADSVAAFLIRGYGVPETRISVVSFGEMREMQVFPRAVRNEPGAELNRRVSFTLVAADEPEDDQ